MTTKDGESRVEVCAYQLKNTTRHHYSWPVKGYLRVAAWWPDGRPLANVVHLAKPDAEIDSIIPYSLSHQGALRFAVVVDFTRLQNPIERDTYRVIVYRGIQDNGEEREITEGEWQLAICRATDRTSVSLRVIDHEQRESPGLNEDRLTLAQPFRIGDSDNPIPVRTGSGGAQGRTPLFSLRLANACRNGLGFARWRCRLHVVGHQGMGFKSHPLQLVDDRGIERMSGKLRDSSDASQRVFVLTAELENDESNLRILQQRMALDLMLGVDWEVYEDGDHDLENVRRFSTELAIRCALKHEPPNHVLAVDFGTSAVAIAHAVGPVPRLLDLQDRLRERQKIDRRIYRLDNAIGSSPFLSSECNVNANEEQLKKLRPNNKDFLVLPLLVDTIRSAHEKVFLSLKALVSTGLKTLPFPVQKYPYLGPDGETLETTKEPPLHEVIEGAYRGLMAHYIKPILNAQGLDGFSYILVTHPNTYTPNHVQQLREVVEKVFVNSPDIAPPHVIYPENIAFFSESDAVAFYYLVRARELHGGDWSKIPDCERILVYDIGAGTLDLTHLEVEWESNPSGGKTPKMIRIKHRAGANRAGNLLDECIARDLHEHLQHELDDELYKNPIVVPGSQSMDDDTRQTMDHLRQEIQKLKVQLSEGQEEVHRLLLTSPVLRKPIVGGEGGETSRLYGNRRGLAVSNNEIYWEQSREQILNGRYVQAFFAQVTHREILDFFNDRKPVLDTVIISGRTWLLPGFEDGLRETLGAVPNWVSLNHDAEELKKAVVLGVMERHFRWRHLVVEDPGIIGDFAVLYEHSGPRDWHYHIFEHSEESHVFYLGNAALVKIGVRTSNGFHQCFAFNPSDYYSDDRQLEIKLIFDRHGRLQAEVQNSRGSVQRFREATDVAILPYKDRPWPLGTSKLSNLEPKEAVALEAFGEPVRQRLF